MAAPATLQQHYCLIMTRLLLMLLCAGISQNFVSATPKAIITTLDAKWPSTPFILEACEYLATESNELFWKFIESLPDTGHLSERDQHDRIFSTLDGVAKLSQHELRLLKFSLSIRQFAPAVQLHQELARDKNPGGCPAFADIHGEVACDPSQIADLVKRASERASPMTFKFDHRYPSAVGSGTVTVILYAHVGTASFHSFHEMLKNLVSTGSISTYVFRHYVKVDPSLKPLRLSGYGVEMAIKSTEYKAKDDAKVASADQGLDDELEGEIGGFNFTRLRDRFPKLKKELQELKAHLSISSYELSPLKVWELQDLSLQAAQKAITAQSLEVLRDLSQNFPSLAKSLARTALEPSTKAALSTNQKYVEALHMYPGDAALYINGMQLDLDSTDAFILLDLLRAESKLMDALNSIGLSHDKIQQLLRTASSKAEKGEFALDIRDPAVVYINDLEHDPAYRHWPKALQSLLQPSFPGMMRHIAKNIFNLVLFVDPASQESIVLLKMAYVFQMNQVPIRVGIVPATTSEEGIAVVKLFSYIHDEISASEALEFLYHFYNTVGSSKVTQESVVAYFRRQHPRADYADILASKEYDEPRKAAVDFHARSGLPKQLPQALVNGARLADDTLTDDAFEDGVVRAVLQATSEVQAAVYRGQLHDGMDAFEWIMTRPNVVPRLNARVLTESTRHASFFDSARSDHTKAFLNEIDYITKKDDNVARPLTLWIVADLEAPAGRLLYYEAIKHVKTNAALRLAVIHSGSVPPTVDSAQVSISLAVSAAMATLSPSEARSFVTKLVKEEFAAGLLDGTKAFGDLEVHGMDTAAFLRAYEDSSSVLTKRLARQRAYVTDSLGLPAGALALVCNGLIVGPLNSDEVFTADDVALLTKVTLSNGAEEVLAMMGQAAESSGEKPDPRVISDHTMTTSSIISSSPSASKLRKRNPFQNTKNGIVHIPPTSPDLPSFEVLAILDPLTRAAQKLTHYLHLLQNVVNADIKVVMNCREKLSDMPLKNFYRYVADPEISFNDDGSRSAGPVASFDHLPQKSILTLNMHPPDSWLVESVRTPFDLDNVLLSEVKVDIHAEYELEHLLIEGHCYDATSGQPPRGLQFVMGTGQATTDTIVMANLGYFQLKANPGVWQLQLREGRSRDIYEVVSHENTDSPPNSPDLVAVINSFNSKILRLKVKKRAGKMNEDVLGTDNEDIDEQPTLWNSIASSFTGSAPTTVKDYEKDETLNIFSLASGHLYERFLRIMMFRVVKTTQSKVKFWLLKNYLSPTFKQFIPHMAAEYGFEYELVQYKWPRWLNQQTEKQRVMWGYKILFLDVLFPLDVKKIIFVDADQIVLGDLQELYDLDLEGAPYGYTPFCENRKEMDGFRFWKSGYWASHLGGRPYHISALYVVDLKKFRKIAAGDRLRGQYQGLSQDPNSLSNLDQDLPNNMIHQVRIKSLPQEWLWCETWCNDESKKKAKTIDLCNNPLTKEPKLQAAQRIVPEWPNYDNEIKALFERVYGANGTSAPPPSGAAVPASSRKGGTPVREEL